MVNDLTVARTPNPDCGACLTKQLHTGFQWQTFHPYAGHGFTPEQGWTHKDLGESRWSPPKAEAVEAVPVPRSTPTAKRLPLHAEDAGNFVCGSSDYGVYTKERLEVTCEKCLEILNR